MTEKGALEMDVSVVFVVAGYSLLGGSGWDTCPFYTQIKTVWFTHTLYSFQRQKIISWEGIWFSELGK